MRNGIVLSGLLHLALIAVAVWGLPKGQNPPPEPRVIPIEFIAMVAEERSVPVATPKPPLPPEPPSLPEPAPVETAKPPPPPEPPSLPEPAPVEMALATTPEPAPAPTPEPPPPKPEPPKAAAPAPASRPLPVPKVKPKPPPKPAAPPPPPPKVEAAAPKPKPPPPPKPEKPAAPPAAPKKDDFLSRMRRAVARHPAPAPTTLARAEAPASTLEDRGNRLTMSEEDAVRQHIIGCWNPPVGAPDALDMEVRIIGRLRRDGVVQTVELVERDKLRVRDEPFFRTFAESALRAFYKCKRLPLPPDKYQAWKTFNIGFNLKNMLGE